MIDDQAASASVNIDFEAVCDGGNYLAAELDSELNVGKTCFQFGEAAYFRVHKSPADMAIEIMPSDGTIIAIGTNYSQNMAENVTFVNTNSAQLSKIIKLIQSYQWYGRSLGIILKVGDLQIRSELSGIAVGYIKYTTEYDVYSITVNPPANYKEWPVVVVISEVL